MKNLTSNDPWSLASTCYYVSSIPYPNLCQAYDCWLSLSARLRDPPIPRSSIPRPNNARGPTLRSGPSEEMSARAASRAITGKHSEHIGGSNVLVYRSSPTGMRIAYCELIGLRITQFIIPPAGFGATAKGAQCCTRQIKGLPCRPMRKSSR